MDLPSPPAEPFRPRRWSLLQWGAAATAATVLLGLLPGFAGVGWLWAAGLLAGAAVLWLRAIGRPPGPGTWVASPWLGPAYAAVVCAWAWQFLGWGLVPLLWLGSAGLLLAALAREAPGAAWSQGWDLAQLRRGYGLYLPIGAALCLVALLLTWGQTGSYLHTYLSGGMRMAPVYSYGTGYYNYQMQYQPNMYVNGMVFPGFAFSGRAQAWALWVELAVLAAVAWGARARPAGAAVSVGFRRLGLGLVAALALWWLQAVAGLASRSWLGPGLFLLGLACLGAGVWFLARGQRQGPYQPEALWARLRRRQP